MKKNIELELAFNFIQKTDRNLFLTGKAGTGKTTFLHRVKKESYKRLIIVAPTGVAAINAKGTTIHSFFQMPFGPILPDTIQNKSTVQRRFSKTKIDIIKSLDLVIIDEISMVRADLLDGIDQVLRRYKDRSKVFGGVQILMIGDLQQLAPVVKPNEWNLLKPYYDTVYFFSSNAFTQCKPITIELQHIYRQDNPEFIAILNEIRNNQLSSNSVQLLNERYQPNFKPSKKEGYITLTTHNRRAEAINVLELNQLKTKTQNYTAEIEGKFNEYAYPTYEKLSLKMGAQVMFIKNDSTPEKRYFNGKIGEIIALDNDTVTIDCPDDEFPIETSFEIWENITYTLNPNSKEIQETIIGSFKQIPLRLAWAITIHKSQGLTFEKAIIDAEASFAHGQTYVAMSRCKSLEGIVLKTPLNETSIINDTNINKFNEQVTQNHPNERILKESEKEFQQNLIADLFNYYPFLYPLNRLIDLYYTYQNSFEGTIIEPLLIIKDKGIIPLLKIGTAFRQQISTLSATTKQLEKSIEIQTRFKKAIAYFTEQTEAYIQTPLKNLTYSTENKAVKKDFEKQLKNIEKLAATKQFCLQALTDGFATEKYLNTRAKAELQTLEKQKIKINATTTIHPSLFEALRLLRDELALTNGVPLFQIFTQKTLYEMCEALPTTNKQMQAIHGMGKIRVKNYGSEIIECITNYCHLNKIEFQKDLVVVKKENTKQVSYSLFKKGLSIGEIAKQRNFVVTTIQGHLASFIPTGEIDILEIISKQKLEEIKKRVQNIKFEHISELREKTNNIYTYNELRLVLDFIKLTSKNYES